MSTDIAAAHTIDRAPAQMKRRLSRQVSADVVAICDILAMVLGGLLPALIYAVAGKVAIDQIMVMQSVLVAGFIAHLCLRFRGMYDTSRMESFPLDPFELMIAVICGMVGVLGIGLPLALRNMHIAVWYAAWVSASFCLMLYGRMMARNILAKLATQGRFDERIAVFGAGQIARRVHDYLKTPGVGIHFAGVFDDRAGQDRLNPEGLEVTGKLEDLITACREGSIDRIVVALPQAADQRVSKIIEKFADLPVSTHIVTHIASDLIDSDISHKVSNLGPVGLLDLKKKN
jgi:FlaA1/EpsC-like NDP-sugar epimerase